MMLVKFGRLICLIVILHIIVCFCNIDDIHATKVFIMVIGPWWFNWTDPSSIERDSQYSYRPSLLNAPDLPPWMYYTYSDRLSRGFVYGAPPPNQRDFQIELVGLNKMNYEARRRIITLKVSENNEPALYEILLKVDKINVEDILNSDRYNQLLDVFRKSLWPASQHDLYMTFIASAVHLGARLPLNPVEGEGVVMRIGSRAPFSQTLIDLQTEVRPLRAKGLTNCPDFKHTSVERFFKQYNFSLDWCAFQLRERVKEKSLQEHNPSELESPSKVRHVWHAVSKQGLPTRHYLSELVLTLVIPLFCLVLMLLLLTLTICFHQLSLKHSEEAPDSLLVQYEAVQRASNTLRSLSAQRDLDDVSPRVSMERTGLRPDPPPYSGVNHSIREAILDEADDDAKTWYC